MIARPRMSFLRFPPPFRALSLSSRTAARQWLVSLRIIINVINLAQTNFAAVLQSAELSSDTQPELHIRSQATIRMVQYTIASTVYGGA